VRIILIIIGFLISDSLTAQYWVGGDKIGLELNTIEIIFNIDSKVKFDIDCDGKEDFHIQSYSKKTNLSPWIQLIISMEDNVEVLKSVDWLIREMFDFVTIFGQKCRQKLRLNSFYLGLKPEATNIRHLRCCFHSMISYPLFTLY